MQGSAACEASGDGSGGAKYAFKLKELKDAAARSLGVPLGDTKGCNCIKKPEICMNITADQIEVTGDVLWLKDYFPMFNGEVQRRFPMERFN